ncbi:ABC transporter substrate-binding protein [Brachybacterium saurashtrense]|uniref:Peptide ABC transporter substrate-binding protein n=1 Tax=Brachybacterium saurashtrense TaxID=556288 RepID=A0A345YMX7_9MICO|nr:ABC transporter substrate-binding protein [Brachybacterium saurashtrense]AXK45279.1 peptide ABC transporter substrate-binding protein [Brachybacterium saurashtrense]RRR21965.1 peptide ABC transporter substrate-binding protein [Brachybacterium saurashtrense]
MFDAALTPTRRTLLLSMAGVPVLLSACAQTSEDGGDGGGSGGEGGTITVGTTDKVTSLDPAAAYDNGSSTVWTQCYGYLLSVAIGSEDGRPEPDLAETAEFTGDTVYTVTLKEGLTFANGNTLTSEDVKHSFDRTIAINDPNGPSSLLGNLDSVEIVDDLTVEFHLKQAGDQTFPYVLTSPAGPIVDADVFPADEVLPDNDIVDAEAFSGPYRITSWAINELVTFEAFEDYAGLYGTPATASVVMSYYADQNNMKLDIQQGNIDCVWRSLSATDIADLQSDDAVTVHDGPGGEIRYIVFNFHTNPYGEETEDADPDKARAVRQAVADLLDREAISTSVYNGTYTPLYSYIPEGLPGSGTQFQDMYGDGSGGPDPDRARTRLEDAGVEIPVSLSLQYNPDHYGNSSGDEYAAVKSQLEADGLFEVDLQSTEWVQYSEDRVADVYPAYQLGWFPDYSDADNYLAPFFATENFLGNHYSNPEVDELIAQQRGTEDEAEREALFVQIQDLVAEDISTLPLLQGAQIAVSTAEVQGVTLDSSFKFRVSPLSK